MKKVNNISVGNAGGYFVAGELERNGFSVAIPMSNTELFDILALNRKTKSIFAIQVKTTHLNKKEWTLSKKNETINNLNIFYVFVSMNGLSSPEYHIVPSAIVAEAITNGHKEWLNTPGRKGYIHQDNPMRKFNDYNDLFLNRWDLIK